MVAEPDQPALVSQGGRTYQACEPAKGNQICYSAALAAWLAILPPARNSRYGSGVVTDAGLRHLHADRPRVRRRAGARGKAWRGRSPRSLSIALSYFVALNFGSRWRA